MPWRCSAASGLGPDGAAALTQEVAILVAEEERKGGSRLESHSGPDAALSERSVFAHGTLLTVAARVCRSETTTFVVCVWSADPVDNKKGPLTWSGRRDSNPRPQRPEVSRGGRGRIGLNQSTGSAVGKDPSDQARMGPCAG